MTVTASELTVRKVSHRGRVREWTLNPVWVQLDRIVHEEFGVERLFLVSRGRRLPIAAFLGPDEKASFAQALAAAHRRGQARADADGGWSRLSTASAAGLAANPESIRPRLRIPPSRHAGMR